MVATGTILYSSLRALKVSRVSVLIVLVGIRFNGPLGCSEKVLWFCYMELVRHCYVCTMVLM